MSATCPRCGLANAESSTSCARCQEPLTHGLFFPQSRLKSDESPTSSEHSVSRPAGQGERRQLTVMFCDLVGSVALSHGLDPEDFGDLIRSYQLLCREAVERFEGYVATY